MALRDEALRDKIEEGEENIKYRDVDIRERLVVQRNVEGEK